MRYGRFVVEDVLLIARQFGPMSYAGIAHFYNNSFSAAPGRSPLTINDVALILRGAE